MNRSFVAQFGITLSKSFFSTVLTRLIIDAWLCSRISTTMPRKAIYRIKEVTNPHANHSNDAQS